MKVTVRVPRPRIHHSSLGAELLKRFAEAASEYGTVEKNAKLEGRNMAMFMVPKTAKETN